MELAAMITTLAVARDTGFPAEAPLPDRVHQLADDVLNPLRAWLTNVDMALTDVEDAAHRAVDADPCARRAAHDSLTACLAVLHCEMTSLLGDACEDVPTVPAQRVSDNTKAPAK